ncbi:putative SAM-dependent methyltransferase [Terracoccus luteus]|uniref:Putative SAM-dependent methyltransferase n=1 Tax=Terracoccus luteus TaxID=53356 RepID=A0A839Q189_9MICO|nr:putative SAM-dependent methyltransferase [Terracoccus luteus]MCP2172010.1 putative SAM-dependent methyltransferase [Terracoccus luteus]
MTAAFVTNVLHVVNRELGADFDVDAFSYVPFWDPHEQRMDLRLRAELAAAGFAVDRIFTDPDDDFALTLARREG